MKGIDQSSILDTGLEYNLIYEIERSTRLAGAGLDEEREHRKVEAARRSPELGNTGMASSCHLFVRNRWCFNILNLARPPSDLAKRNSSIGRTYQAVQIEEPLEQEKSIDDHIDALRA